jgi:hypothetical protein
VFSSISSSSASFFLGASRQFHINCSNAREHISQEKAMKKPEILFARKLS